MPVRAVLVAALLLVLVSPAFAASTRVVVVIDNYSLKNNQTIASVEFAIADVLQNGLLDPTEWTALSLQVWRLGFLTAASLAELNEFIQNNIEPTLYLSLVQSDSVAFLLSQANVTYVDIFSKRDVLEPAEIAISFESQAFLGAAVDFLDHMNWTFVSLMQVESSRELSDQFEMQTSQKGISIDHRIEVPSSSSVGITAALPELLEGTSNILVVIAPQNVLDLLLEKLTSVYELEILWVPVDSNSIRTDLVRPEQLTASIGGFFSVEIEKGPSKLQSMTVSHPNLFQDYNSTTLNVLYAFDAVLEWANALNTTSNPNLTADVIASARATSEQLVGTVSGAITFDNNNGKRVGDLCIKNYKKESGPGIVAKWRGSAAGLVSVVPTTEMTFSSGSNVKPPSMHKKLFLIGLLWDTVYPEDVVWLQAAQMAVEQINQRQFIPGMELRASFYDDHYTSVGTVRGAVALADLKVKAVVGAASSTLAIAAHNYLSGVEIPLISPAATSDALSIKEKFPHFLRTISPDRFAGKVMAELAATFRWKSVCTLNYQSDYGTNLVNQFASEHALNNGTILARPAFFLEDTDLHSTIKVLTASNCRIIFAVLPYHDVLSLVFKEIKAQGLFGPGFQWVFADEIFSLFEWDVLKEQYGADPVDLKGSILVPPSAGESDSALFQTFQADLAAFRPPEDDTAPDFYTPFVYDAVWTVAYTAKTIATLPGGPTAVAAQLNNQTAILEFMKATKFDGVTGHVGFDENGDRTGGVYGIFQWTGNQSAPLPLVGIWQGDGIALNRSTLVFSDGSNNPPLDRLLVPEQSVLYSWGGVAAITAGLVLVLVLVISTIIAVLFYRENNLIYRSSPFFLIVILLGITVALCSIFFWFGEAAAYKCHLRVWLGFCGFIIAYGALLVKNARLWYLFNEPSLRIIAITNPKLVGYLLCLMAPQALILILWSALAPFRIVPVPSADRLTNYLLCSSANDNVFGPLSLAYMGVLLVIGGVLSFKTRTLPDIFKESTYIALATYNFIFISAVCIIIGYSFYTSPVATVVVATVGMIVGGFMNWVLIFVPKFYLVLFRPEKVAAMSMSHSSSRTVNRGGSGSVNMSSVVVSGGGQGQGEPSSRSVIAKAKGSSIKPATTSNRSSSSSTSSEDNSE